MIKKTPVGYVIYSEKGKKLSKAYPTKEEAEKRLKQIEYFKHAKDSKKYSKEKLEKDIRKPLEKFLLSEGYEKDEIDDYLVIEIKEEDEDITNNDNKCIHIQVRNEFVDWYDLPTEVCDALDKAVAPGYFEPYDATTWDAYIFENARLKDNFAMLEAKDTLLHPELYGKNVKLIVNNALSSTVDKMYGEEIISKNVIDKNKIEYVLPYDGRVDYFNRRFNRKFEVVDSIKNSVNYVIENAGIDMNSIKEVSEDCFVLRGIIYGKENGEETFDTITFLYHLDKNKVEILNFFNKFSLEQLEQIADILLENINTNHIF